MADLTDQQKLFIVERLACFYSPKQVRKEFAEEFKTEIGNQQVCFYDPFTVAGRRMDAKWKEIFTEVRTRYLEETSDVPITDQRYRFLKLYRLAEEHADNPGMILKIFRFVAMEQGGVFNRQQEAAAAAPETAYNLANLSAKEADILGDLLEKAAQSDGVGSGPESA